MNSSAKFLANLFWNANKSIYHLKADQAFPKGNTDFEDLRRSVEWIFSLPEQPLEVFLMDVLKNIFILYKFFLDKRINF